MNSNNYMMFIFRFKRLASDDEDEMESYRSVVSTPKKAKMANKFHSTQIVPTDQDFRPGDFVVLRDESNQDQVCKSTFLIQRRRGKIVKKKSSLKKNGTIEKYCTLEKTNLNLFDPKLSEFSSW